ncbi:MAG: MurR/RpiR family transcriptional regulator [Syntrophobacteraceae bacterium]|nr:MurR/RpiR family transcriptional regulator [Desulfobacteraceae bacterium]
MENVLAVIRRHLPYLNPALKKIAQYILEEPDRVKLLKISELSAACQVSEATVTRFVRAIKFNSFPEFKIAIAAMPPPEENGSFDGEKEFFYNDLHESDSIESVVAKITYKNIQSLKDTQEIISPQEIERAVAGLQKCESIAIYCGGYSAVAAHNFRFRFYRVGKPCAVYSDPIEQAVSAATSNEKRFAVGISSSGKTRCVVDALKIAKSTGATTMCITDSNDSPIVQHSDIRFYTFSKHSDFLQDSLLSRMSQILIIDIIFACYALRDYKHSFDLVERSAKSIQRTTKSAYF